MTFADSMIPQNAFVTPDGCYDDFHSGSYASDTSSKVSYWARNGGGHLGVTVFATGGGGGGHEKFFFEKLIAFGVLARAVENAKNYRLFEKFFRVPKPPVANTVTPKCPPPPVACPVRHIFGKFLIF